MVKPCNPAKYAIAYFADLAGRSATRYANPATPYYVGGWVAGFCIPGQTDFPHGAGR